MQTSMTIVRLQGLLKVDEDLLVTESMTKVESLSRLADSPDDTVQDRFEQAVRIRSQRNAYSACP